MIIDIHTHVGRWEHYSQEFLDEAYRMRGRPFPAQVEPEDYFKVMDEAGVKVSVALAFKSVHLGFHVPNEYVADFVRQHPDRLIGFAAVDPHERGALEELAYAHETLGLRGLKLSSIYQAFHPMDERVLPIYKYCEKHGLPILVHQGTTFPRRAPVKYASPLLMEDVCLAFPDLRIIIAHLGHPWEADTIALLRKHPHLYADLSGLFYRPWQFYNSMMLCWEYGVMNKLLFGSDYPVATPQETIDGIRSLGSFVEGTKFPRIPAEALEEIIYRDLRQELNLL